MTEPVLETDRLILRPPRLEDFESYAEFFADEPSTRYLAGVLDRDGAWKHFTDLAASWFLYGDGKFSIVEKVSGRWVGRVGPGRVPGVEELEVGWSLASEFRRKGYAREAAAAALNHVFDGRGCGQVAHCIRPENTASSRLAADLGAKLSRASVQLTFYPAPVDIWTSRADEWKARRA